MRSRLYVFALLAICALAVPSAFAQRGSFDGGSPQYLPHPSAGVISRAYTTAVLLTPTGGIIGKAKTATVETQSRGIVQGLRVQVTELTPGAEYALVIDGTLVGTDTANANGQLKLKFLSPTNGRVAALPDAIKPIARAITVQIYDVSSQRLVAAGQFRGKESK